MAETESQSDVVSDVVPDVVPGTVFTERQVRILKRVVIAMGVMLVGGFILVISVIVYQATNPSDSTVDSPVQKRLAPAPGAALLPPGELRVPKGMAISHLALDGNRLAVHLTGPAGGEIQIIDLGTGTVVSTISIKSE
jgi:hypothetical protein